MAIITKPYTFSANTAAVASQVNSDFDTIYAEFNGGITNANISASAAIASSKISGTAATLTGSETLTNKTLTKPTLNASVQGITAYTPSASATATLDLSIANVHVITMPAGNITIAISNATIGQYFSIEIIQDSGGSRTVTWFSTITWVNATAPTLTTTASRKDTFVFRVTGSGTYNGYIAGQNIG